MPLLSLLTYLSSLVLMWMHIKVSKTVLKCFRLLRACGGWGEGVGGIIAVNGDSPEKNGFIRVFSLNLPQDSKIKYTHVF